MIVQCHHLVSMVRTRLNLDRDPPPWIEGDSASASLAALIGQIAVDSARVAIDNAPLDTLVAEGSDFTDADVYWHDGDDSEGISGHVLLPADFHRLVTFKMSDWLMAQHTIHGADSVRAAMGSSSIGAIRGSRQRPCLIMAQLPEGRAVTFHSCGSRAATIEYATYIPYPVIDSQGGLTIPSCCLQATVGIIADTVKDTLTTPL